MKTERRKTRYCFLAIGALLLVLLAQPALAVDKHWVGSPFTLGFFHLASVTPLKAVIDDF
jgi:hypothetical protein